MQACKTCLSGQLGDKMSLASGQSKNKPTLSWKYSCYDKDTHIPSNNQALVKW